MKIALDAMGGDSAPDVEVQGALDAVEELGVEITLVGNRASIERSLGSRAKAEKLSVYHCDEVVGMDETPLKAVRNKRDSSIRVAFELAKQDKVAAVVSAGNSGATMAAGVLILGRMKGAERPAIGRKCGLSPGAPFPIRRHGPCLCKRLSRRSGPENRFAQYRGGREQGKRAG